MKDFGFNSMGKPVSAFRLNKGYKAIKAILGCDSEEAFLLSNKIKQYIERDECSFVIGNINGLEISGKCAEVDSDLAKIDVTGRYRVLAEMLSD